MWVDCELCPPATNKLLLLWCEDAHYLGYLDKKRNWNYDCDPRMVPEENPTFWHLLPDHPNETIQKSACC